LAYPGKEQWELFTCLTSLRDVEPSVNLILNNYEIETTGINPPQINGQEESE
jgi:hypothetical protein